VILGAGFAGLWAAKELRRAPVDITVVDRNNYHTFFPLLYQVAAAELQPGDIVHPVRAILSRQPNASFTLAEVTNIDIEDRTLATSAGPIHYDHLILGPGSTTEWFGVDGAEEHAFALRTLDEAIQLRNHVLERIEAAHRATGLDKERDLTFVVVGGGPTGVEFAGALQELITGPIARDHRGLDLSSSRTVLVEAGPSLLPAFRDRLSEYARRRLTKKGVEVQLGTQVERVDPDGIDLANGGRIESATVVWATGVSADPGMAGWGLPTGHAGRVQVLPTLQVDGHPEVWVGGDSALPASSGPMVAQNAMQQGRLAARNLRAVLDGHEPTTYRYRDYGTMAVIGRNAAVVQFRKRWSFTGYPAWLMWLGLHIIKLIGFRNRLAALISWTGDYIFRDRVARLIIRTRR